MLNTPLSDVDHVARPLVAIGTDYRPGALLDSHTHRRAQFLYGMTGVMEVDTDDGTWMVPPFSGVWLPAGKRHQVRMNGVSTRSLYIEPHVAPRTSLNCEVLVVTPLLHHLLLASAHIPALYDENGRDGALAKLLLYELEQAQALPLFAPLPQDLPHWRLCVESFLASCTSIAFPRSGPGSCIAVSAPSIACSVNKPVCPSPYGANRPA